MRIIMKYGGAPAPCGSFTYGEVEEYTVEIIQGSGGGSPPPDPEPPLASYCPSSGSITSYEWADRIAVGVYTKQSGRNNGYADSSAEPAIALARGTNSIVLTPGYQSASYYEYWAVWIDFDGDGLFATGEQVFNGGASGALSGSFEVPSNAPSGNTRMRISMKYGGTPGACDSFTYGEVEDYTVQIN